MNLFMTQENHDIKLERELKNALAGLTVLNYGRALHEVLSTNDVMLHYEKSGETDGSVVIAGLQTVGRGRFKRTWFMKEGDIAMSILLRSPHVPRNWALISLLPAVAVAEGLLSLGIPVKLKWPNDIIVPKLQGAATLSYCGDFRKVGGILVDNVFQENTLAATVIGIGLNIVQHDEIRESVPHSATLAGYKPGITRAACLSAILPHFDRIIANVGQYNFAGRLLASYSVFCETLGKDVVVSQADGAVHGRAVRLDEDGALVVRHENGEMVVRAGDVTFSR